MGTKFPQSSPESLFLPYSAGMASKYSKSIQKGSAFLYLAFAGALVLMLGYILLSNVPKYSVDAGTAAFWFFVGVSIPTASINYFVRSRMIEILKEDEASNWELRLFHSREYKVLQTWKNGLEITLVISLIVCATFLLS